MGDRASYAIRKGGAVRLFYSHWGSLTVPQDVFWGPQHAERFILSLEERGAWLDDVWAEGGVVLDHDERVVAFFGGDELDRPEVRPVFVSLMAEVWSPHGWQVRWVEGIEDLAVQVGVDPAVVRSPPLEVPFERLGEDFEAWGRVAGVISVPGAAGWADHVVDTELHRVLMLGPAFLDRLDEIPSLARARRAHAERDLRPHERAKGTLGDHLDEAVVIDPTGRRLRYLWADMDWSKEMRFVPARWPGWSVECVHGALADHFAATGRELPEDLAPEGVHSWKTRPPPEPLSEPEIPALIRRELLGRSEAKARAEGLARATVRAVGGLGGTGEPASLLVRLWRRLTGATVEGAVFVTGFLTPVPRTGPDDAEAERILDRALTAYRRGHGGTSGI